MLTETTARVSNLTVVILHVFLLQCRVSMNRKTVHAGIKLKRGMHVISLQMEAEISAQLVLCINFNTIHLHQCIDIHF